MTYPVNIVINDRNWYDSRINETDAVVFQNVNYVSGNSRSVNKVRHRFLQDWARRVIPNSVRQGVGLGDPAGASDQITVTEGYAIVGGRFINVPAGTFDASVEGLTDPNNPTYYYLVIKVTLFVEGDEREPTDGTAFLKAVAASGYTKDHNELVLAKFSYNGSVIDNFEDYTAQEEWMVSVLSPIPVRPGFTSGSNISGSNSILLRAGSNERVDNLGIETDKTRFYLNAVFNDQTSSTEVKLINNNGILETRDLGDTAYLGQDMLNLKIGGTTILNTLSGGTSDLTNIGTINNETLGDNTANSFVLRTATQTLTNKTLTSPTVTDGTYDTPVLTTPHIQDTSSDDVYIFAVSELTADRTVTLPLLVGNDTFVFEDHIQTLTDKTLVDAIFTSFLYADGGNRLTVPNINDTLVTKTTTDTLSNKTLATLKFLENDASPSQTYTITGQALSANRTLTVPTAVSDTFLMSGYDHSVANGAAISGIKEFTTDNIFTMTGNVWSSATHTHDANNQGGIISHSNLGGSGGNIHIDWTSDQAATNIHKNNLGWGSEVITTLNNLDADGSTISGTQWNYLDNMNQHVSTTSGVTFANITVDNTYLNGNNLQSTTGNLYIQAEDTLYLESGSAFTDNVVINASDNVEINAGSGDYVKLNADGYYFQVRDTTATSPYGVELTFTNTGATFNTTSTSKSLFLEARVGLDGIEITPAGTVIIDKAFQLDGIPQGYGSGDVLYYDTVSNRVEWEQEASSIETKKDLKPLKYNREAFYNLESFIYTYKKSKEDNPNKTRVGLIAEHVNEVNPLLAINGDSTESGIIKYDERGFSTVMFEEIKRHEKSIKSQQETIDMILEKLENCNC